MKRQKAHQPVASAGGRGSFLRGSPWRSDWACALLLIVVTFLAYSSAWFGKPVWDDDAHIPRPELRSLTGLANIWIQPGATQQYYPLAFSAFWVQHKLWGDATQGYHLVNILLHVASALLVLRILRQLEIPGAWLAAAIFALHPVQVESVAWISELKNTLSGVFYFGAMLVYLNFDRTRGKGPYALALGLFALGLMTKTAIATLPAGLLVVFWWKRGTLSWKTDVLPLVPFFLVGLGAGLVTVWAESRIFGAQGVDFRFSMVGRCLIAGHAVWFHLGKLFWPADLTFMYPRWNISHAAWWQYLYPAAVVLLVATLWAVRRQNRGPLVGLLFFIGTLFPALGFFNAYSFRYSFANDHHQYLASLGIISLVSAGVVSWTVRWPMLRAWGCCLLLAILAGLTWRHAGAFQDDEALWRDTLAKNPGCWMAHHNWAVDLAARGEFEAASEHYRAELRLNPDAEAHLGLGSVLEAQGKAEQAAAEYLAAIQVKPDYAEAYNNLSSLFVKQANAQQALRYAAGAVRLKPGYAQAHFNLGNAFNLLGKTVEAAAEYSTAVRLKPDYAEAHYNLGGAMFLLGKPGEAAAHLAEAVRYQPDNPAAHSKLAFVLLRQGKTADALGEYHEALRLQPDSLESLKNVAWVLSTNPDPQYRNGAEAVRLANRAVQLAQEKDAAALDALAAAYAESGDFASAVATANRALSLVVATNQTWLRGQIEARRTSYQAGRPWRD